MKNILNIAYYEVLHILKDPILFLMVFIAPLVYCGIFGAVYYSAVISHIPVGVVDLDNSHLSREVVEAFNNDPNFKVVKSVNSYQQLKQGMKDGTVRAGMVVPEDFESRLMQHRTTQILAIYDGSNLIWGYNTRRNMLTLINQFSARYASEYLAGQGLTSSQIEDILDAVSLNTTVWYNPTFSYLNFMFIAIMMMVVHQIGLLSVSLTATREKEHNCWIQYLAAPVARGKIILGKCLPYLVMNFFNYTLLLWVSAALLHTKVEGHVLFIIIFGLLYDIIITFTGFFISVQAPNSLQVTRYIMLLSVPFFMMSGYTWPDRYIPGVLNAVADMLPFTWMAKGLRLATIKNLGPAELMPYFKVMALMAIIAVGLAFTFNKRRKPPAEELSVNCGARYPNHKMVFSGRW